MIVCVAANPSIDKLFEVPRLRAGAIHRPERFVAVPGGKGLNVARAAATLGARVTAVPLLAGHAGRWIEDALAAENVASAGVWATTGETRSSLSVADRETGGLTEFYEDGAPVELVDWEALEAAARAAVDPGAWVTLSGSAPPGAPEDAYARLIRIVREAGAVVAIDARGTALRRAMEASPDLVKVNDAEASEVVGGPAETDADALAAADDLARRSGGGAVAVTRGRRGCVLVAGDVRLRGAVDAIGPYPVGSGDSFLAGLVVGRDRGSDWMDALRLAVGAAAANAEEPGAGRLRPERAAELSGLAEITAAN
jgi:1-phosphofructokinase family hexose kinase